MARQRVPRLPGRDHEDGTVGIGKVINAAIARPVDVQERVRTGAKRAPAHQRVIRPRGRLADVHEPVEHRHFAQNRVVMGRLMRIAPAQAFEGGTVCFLDPDDGVVEGEAGDLRAGFPRGGLFDVTPRGCAIDIAVDPFDEKRLDMGKLVGKRAQLIADQAVLQGTNPSVVDQRLGQVFVHLTVPVGQQRERALALAFRGAVGGRFPGEPQIGTDQGQQGARGEADGIKLGLNKAFAGVDLARLHKAFPALNALAVAPIIGDMVGERAFDGLVVGVAQNAAIRVNKDRVNHLVHAAFPAVFRAPAGAGQAAFALVTCIAARDCTDGAHGDAGVIGKGEVLRRRDIVF